MFLHKNCRQNGVTIAYAGLGRAEMRRFINLFL